MNYINTQYNAEEHKLKHSQTGLEVEIHLIDLKGSPCYRAQELIDEVKRRYPDIQIVKECAKNLIEFGCYPDTDTHNPIMEIMNSVQKTIEVAKEMGILLYPFGTYPGKLLVNYSDGGKYEVQKKIYGEKKFELATKVAGFHHHHVLPKGVFDYEKKDIKVLIDSKLGRSMLSCYNFEIAIDPIVTLFTQSSPFIEGKRLGKDSRMIVYRGGKKLDYKNGLYSKYQQFGGLPPYKQTATDLMNSLHRRRDKWKKLIKDNGENPDKLYPNELDIGWNPVKLNKHGTIEQRGMDMSYFSTIVPVTIILRECLHKIQQHYLDVIPTDLGMTKPFLEQNGLLLIPPHTQVRNNLQKASAYEGFENEELVLYTKKFLSFAKTITNDSYKPLIKILEQRIKKRKSVSDEIIQYAKKKGFSDELNQKQAAKIALVFSRRFELDLQKTINLLNQIVKD
ncbi:MAG: hypothetical protein ACMXYG_03235 [Candidatus Woesearchaeota archaeon]